MKERCRGGGMPVAGLAAVWAMLALTAGTAQAAGKGLSEEPIPMATEEDLPERTAPPVEIGPDFLGRGNLPQGIELPTGAVWNPAFWVYGNYRTGYNYFDPGGSARAVSEWANDLDLFGNLHLSGTERVLVGFAPVSDDGEFSGYTFEPERAEGWDNAFNGRPTRLFFEGEIVEMFPGLDPNDRGIFDIGMSVGRQPLLFQEGILIDDDQVDGVALTRDTIIIPGLSVDTRLTAFYGWNEVNRGDNRDEDGAELFGLFMEGDWGWSTVQIDAAYVAGDQDSVHYGIGAIQRLTPFGRTVNTAIRVNRSDALEEPTPAARNGTLVFGEFSITPHGTHDVAYLNLFWGANEYRSALRDETAGGPLGRTGILFAAVGLGNYGSALSNQADNVVGAAIGRQFFWDGERKQIIVEIGGRAGTEETTADQAAIGARYQQALGRRFVLRFDGFVASREGGDDASGVRTELLTRF